mgnify:CR=1 FL=1
MENAQTDFSGLVTYHRKTIKDIGKMVLLLKAQYQPLGDQSDQAEVMANIVLAYRHLEDAAMRLGKVHQSLDGGISVYDK